MKVNVEFHNVDPSAALKKFVQERSEKLAKFLKGSEDARWVFDFKDKKFNPHLNLSLKGHPMSFHSKADDAYVAASEILEKAMKVLAKRHDKQSKSH
jgi:ribosomal subunit interface protein